MVALCGSAQFCLKLSRMEKIKISSVSVISGGILSVLSIASYVFPSSLKYLLLNSANIFITNNFLWILLTSSFVEIYSIRYILDIILLVLISRGLINYYSLEQFLLYSLLNILLCSFGSLVYVFYLFYLTNSEYYLLYNTYGFGGILMSLAMLSRQQLTSTPILPQYPAVTFQYLPTMILLLYSFLWIIGIHFLTKDITFYWISYFFSWIYLRYYFKYSVTPP
jgi:hypothetical protein